MLHWYVQPGSRVLFVDDVKIELDDYDALLNLKIDHCRLTDIIHLGGGIYDAILFPSRPPNGILKRVFEKIYWGGHVIICGIEPVVENVGYQIVKGDPGILVLRRPPAPPSWSREFYLEFQLPGKYWNAATKKMHPAYRQKFAQIDMDWEDKIVIEYGCGRGEITRLIALAGAREAWAIDSSPAACELTKCFCDDLDNVMIRNIDALEFLLHPQWSADVIVALDFVEHFSEKDLPRLFGQMHKNLVDGGLVHIVTPLGRDHVRDHKWHPMPKALKEKMGAAGFKEKCHVIPNGSRKFYAEFIKDR